MGYHKNRSRLYVENSLNKGEIIAIQGSQLHYLNHVLRIKKGQTVALFNGRDGEWLCEIREIVKKEVNVICIKQTALQVNLPDIWFLPALLKKSRMDFAVEKATEIGVSKIIPIVTEYSQMTRTSIDRLQKIAIEATEQCGGVSVPKVSHLAKLKEILRDWDKNRLLLFCDEEKLNFNSLNFATNRQCPLAVLVGPEGGFSNCERTMIASYPFVKQVSLGSRVLRAETAAVAALTLTNLLIKEDSKSNI